MSFQNQVSTHSGSGSDTAGSWEQLPLEAWRIIYARFGEIPDINRLQDDGGVSNSASGLAEIPDTETDYTSISETTEEMTDQLCRAHAPRFLA